MRPRCCLRYLTFFGINMTKTPRWCRPAAPGDASIDALAAKTQCRIARLAHGTAKALALLQLESDVLGHQLRIQLRLVDLEDVDEDVAVGALLEIRLELLDLGAFAADHDAGTRGANDQTQLVARTLDLDRAHARRLELFLQLLAQVHIFNQQLIV